jgi:heptosyltransferase-2
MTGVGTLVSSERILVCGTNWLGDSVMSMPAVQALRRAHPGSHLAMLVKRKLVPLWEIHPAVDSVIEVGEGLTGTLRTASALAAARFDRAYVFPNSFRAALLPFLARIPVRIGMRGHQRRFLLTQVSPDVPDKHQAWEYVGILGLNGRIADLEVPRLALTDGLLEKGSGLLGSLAAAPRVGLIPGAAYGPAKRWPAEYFADVGRRLRDRFGAVVLILGAASEQAICSEVERGVGDCAVNLAGRTSLPELAALLTRCRVVVTNDSGGMHLSAASGSPVVAVFGITDPAKTGPLGPHCRVVNLPGVNSRRDIDRDSDEARRCLRSITPDRVMAEILSLLGTEANA